MKFDSALFRPLVLCFASACLAFGVSASADLPDIGSPADAVLPKSEEAQLGRSIMREIRRQGVIINDPELTEYVQSLGHRLAAQHNNGEFEFEFFVVDDPAINAFALPGGHIGVHTGLIAATSNESELAGVIGHEIAHVTQRHIARSVHANQRASLLNLATMLGAILAAAAADTGSDGIQAAVLSSQAIGVQNRINFTRSNEYEADRVGVGIMARAGFNPNGMADFFSTMSREAGPSGARVPEFMRTHPVNSARIAESRGRARALGNPNVADSDGYQIAKGRLTALYGTSGPRPGTSTMRPDVLIYTKALSLIEALRFEDAAKLLADLVEESPEIISYRIAYGRALARSNREFEALAVFKEATRLFPRNVPLSVAYAQVLIDTGEAVAAHALLLDLFNAVPPTLDQVRLITEAALEAGDVAEAHYYQSEYNIMLGDLVGSIKMLREGLELPEISAIQIARFEARIELVAEYLTDEQRRLLQLRKRKPEKRGLAAS